MNQYLKRIWNNTEYRTAIIATALILCIIFAFRYLLPVIIPFLGAFFIAGCLRPAVDFLIQHLKISEKISSALVFFTLILALLLFCKWGASSLMNQLNSLILYLPFYKEQFLAGLGTCCSYIDHGFHLNSGVSFTYATQALSVIFSDFQTTILPKLTTGTAAAIEYTFSSILFLFIMAYAVLCMLHNYPRLFTKGILTRQAREVWDHVTELIFVYLRAEGTLALLQSLIVSIGLRILGYPYFIPLGLLTGIVDAFPVFGSGTLLIPWAMIQFLLGHVKMGIGLLILSALCTINRQLLEPRLLGQKLGMSTLTTLFMMYVGYQVFGIFGFLLGPLGYLLGRELLHRFMNTPGSSSSQ